VWRHDAIRAIEDELDFEYDLINNLLGILSERFKTTGYSFWIITKDEAKDLKALKRSIKKQLKEWKFIT